MNLSTQIQVSFQNYLTYEREMAERTFFYAVWPILKIICTVGLIILTNYILSSLGAWIFLSGSLILISIKIRIKKRRFFTFLVLFGLLYPLLVSTPLLFIQQGTIFLEIPFGSKIIIISQDGIKLMIFYSLRIFSTISIIAFFLYTTPFVHIIHIFKQLHLPTFFLTLLILTYRFFFEMFESLMKILRAESCRHFRRYSFIERFEFYSKMFGMMLVRSMHRGIRVHHAMIARGFNGEFPILNFHPSTRHILLYCIVIIFVSIGAILMNLYIPLNIDFAGVF